MSKNDVKSDQKNYTIRHALENFAPTMISSH